MATDALTDQHAIERFLYHEARLLDEGQLDDWLALFTPDAYYWIPCNANDVDPTRHVSLIYDDRQHLEDRIWRIKSGWAHAQDPPSHTRRIVGNVEPHPAPTAGEPVVSSEMIVPSELVVSSTFILVELRRGAQTLFAGRYEHRLRREGDAWRIALKKVELLNNDEPIDSLTFIV
jgi:benzoate/toluate 1,2-dioxygenase subunit beta